MSSSRCGTDIHFVSYEPHRSQPIPDLLVTHDSLQKVSPDRVCSSRQRINDWITVTSSSRVLNDEREDKSVLLRLRCASAINVSERTPMLATCKQYAPLVPGYTNLTRHFSPLEQLSDSTARPYQQRLLVDDHVASARRFVSRKRNSIASMMSALPRVRRPQFSHTSRSSSDISTRNAPAHPHDRFSQASFQMVSLDTDDTSSCSSSLTHRSASRPSTVPAPVNPSSESQRKKRYRFKNLGKHSANNERKAMRVLLIIFSIFVILWTPFFVINLLSCFVNDVHPILISIATWLGYCSSCANPIIYTIFSRAFRRAFINILTCQKVMRSHRSPNIRPVYRSTSRRKTREPVEQP